MSARSRLAAARRFLVRAVVALLMTAGFATIQAGTSFDQRASRFIASLSLVAHQLEHDDPDVVIVELDAATVGDGEGLPWGDAALEELAAIASSRGATEVHFGPGLSRWTQHATLVPLDPPARGLFGQHAFPAISALSLRDEQIPDGVLDGRRAILDLTDHRFTNSPEGARDIDLAVWRLRCEDEPPCPQRAPWVVRLLCALSFVALSLTALPRLGILGTIVGLLSSVGVALGLGAIGWVAFGFFPEPSLGVAATVAGAMVIWIDERRLVRKSLRTLEVDLGMLTPVAAETRDPAEQMGRLADMYVDAHSLLFGRVEKSRLELVAVRGAELADVAEPRRSLDRAPFSLLASTLRTVEVEDLMKPEIGVRSMMVPVERNGRLHALWVVNTPRTRFVSPDQQRLLEALAASSGAVDDAPPAGFDQARLLGQVHDVQFAAARLAGTSAGIRRTLERAPIGIVVGRPDGTVLSANVVAERLFERLAIPAGRRANLRSLVRGLVSGSDAEAVTMLAAAVRGEGVVTRLAPVGDGANAVLVAIDRVQGASHGGAMRLLLVATLVDRTVGVGDAGRGRTCDAREAVLSALRLARLSPGARPRSIAFDALDPMPRVAVDAARLANALAAFIRASLTQGDAATACSITVDHEADSVVIDIADPGYAIPAAALPFVLLDDPRAPAGTATELATAHQTILDLGGGVEIDSRMGSGTMVRVELPGVQIGGT